MGTAEHALCLDRVPPCHPKGRAGGAPAVPGRLQVAQTTLCSQITLAPRFVGQPMLDRLRRAPVARSAASHPLLRTHVDARTLLAAAGGISAMDYKSLTSLLLRLTGVIIMVLAVTATPRTFVGLFLGNTGGGFNTETWLLTTVASAFPILVGLLLIYFSGHGRQQDRARRRPNRGRPTPGADRIFDSWPLLCVDGRIRRGLLVRQTPSLLRYLPLWLERPGALAGKQRLRRHCSDLRAVRRWHSPAARRSRSRQSLPPAANAAGTSRYAGVNVG